MQHRISAVTHVNRLVPQSNCCSSLSATTRKDISLLFGPSQSQRTIVSLACSGTKAKVDLDPLVSLTTQRRGRDLISNAMEPVADVVTRTVVFRPSFSFFCLYLFCFSSLFSRFSSLLSLFSLASLASILLLFFVSLRSLCSLPSPSCLSLFFLFCESCMNTSLLHIHASLQAPVTDAPTHSRWLKSCHKTEFHFTW